MAGKEAARRGWGTRGGHDVFRPGKHRKNERDVFIAAAKKRAKWRAEGGGG